MKLTFYRPENGLLNGFLETQIKLAEMNGVEVAIKYLDAATASELQNKINNEIKEISKKNMLSLSGTLITHVTNLHT